jgi:hypothetical protein
MQLQSIAKWIGASAIALVFMAAPNTTVAAGSDTVLKASEAQKLLPPAVYYKAQSASVQMRNTGGVKFSDGYYMLAALVDTSGYSSDVASRYQAYLLTEVPLKFGGKTLPAGAWGIGFIGGNKFLVTDIGAHEVLTASYATDETINRPTPLQVLADSAGGFRLYEGRKYVHFTR